MTNYYELLCIGQNASAQEIKKAFRERAKLLHPDLAGNAGGEKGGEEMRKLLVAYETLSNRDRRFDYDRAYKRFVGMQGFDYRTFLMEREDDPLSQAKLIFFELLHLEEEAALSIWQKQGGMDFPMEKYLEREDWMDCSYLLAEELAKKQFCYEAFVMLVNLLREERRKPYFKHFAKELMTFLKELTRLRLRQSVDRETYVECLEALLGLGFSSRDEARWMRSIAETLILMGEPDAAAKVFREALKRNPALPNSVRLRRRLHV